MKKCENCGSDSVYRSEEVATARGEGSDLLPGLGGFWTAARFTVLVCSECGLMQLFADEAACNKVKSSNKWTKL